MPSVLERLKWESSKIYVLKYFSSPLSKFSSGTHLQKTTKPGNKWLPEMPPRVTPLFRLQKIHFELKTMGEVVAVPQFVGKNVNLLQARSLPSLFIFTSLYFLFLLGSRSWEIIIDHLLAVFHLLPERRQC